MDSEYPTRADLVAPTEAINPIQSSYTATATASARWDDNENDGSETAAVCQPVRPPVCLNTRSAGWEVGQYSHKDARNISETVGI